MVPLRSSPKQLLHPKGMLVHCGVVAPWMNNLIPGVMVKADCLISLVNTAAHPKMTTTHRFDNKR
jgi:hypothetical protein